MIEPIIHRFDSVSSTNDIATEMAKSGAPEGTVVLAQSQTKGRGRRGRKWFDKPGQSILMTAVIRPDLPLSRYSELAFTAAVAVAKTIEAECRLRPSLKWPNDVLLRDKKVCGILIENAGGAAIIGIGVNVRQTEFPPELSVPTPPQPSPHWGGSQPVASHSDPTPTLPTLGREQPVPPPRRRGGPCGPTSIALEGGRCTDVDTLANALISRLFSISSLGFEEILARWRKYMWGIGRLVEVATDEETITGTISGIDTDGALVLDCDGDARRIVASVGITET